MGNLVIAYHRKGGKSKHDRKLTELDVETTRIWSRVNGVSVYFSLLQFLDPSASPTAIYLQLLFTCSLQYISDSSPLNFVYLL